MSYTVISYDFFYDAIYFLIIYGKGIHQLIFGGKTKRCEPQLPIPVNTYYDHTESHWQTPATYITYLKKVVVPDKDANIARLKLAIDQKPIVIHDLHYSHKDAAVLRDVLTLCKHVTL